MSILKLVQSRIVGVPLLITQEKLCEIVAALDGRIDPDIGQCLALAFDARQYRKQDQAHTTAEPDPNSILAYPPTTSVVQISGTLVHKSSGPDALSGLQSYSDIARQFESALSDPSTSSIVLDISSPGGEVSGAFDLADFIYQSRGRKPIYAYANDLAASAAYALASAADLIYTTRTGTVGSIGVILVHADKSAQNTSSGISYTTISAGKHKADFSPNSPLSDSALERAQSLVNTIYDLFLSTVSRNLGLTSSYLRSTEALTYMGSAAINAKLAHGIYSKSEFIAMLNQNQKGVRIMPNAMQDPSQAQPQAQPTATPATHTTVQPQASQAIIPTTTTIVHPKSQPDLQSAIASAIASATQAERTRCFEILEACTLGNYPSIAIDLISDGSSPDTARKHVLSLRHAVSSASVIHNNIPELLTPNENPLLKDAKARAAAKQ